ncbi:DUF5335 family protein [Hyphococcus sp.]|jgi:hypothetical protein|uniref:DUF5335 family protein n=1 Tax=Hyphococcus sp. TaxID=2038636 RepID=UPI003D1517FE
MKTEQLGQNEWRPFLERLSKVLEGKRATVEVAGLDIGDQIQTKQAAIYGIVYDPKDNLIEVALEGLDHLIRSPRKVDIAYQNGAIEAIHIGDGEGREQIVRFSDPLMLPAPK